MVITTVSQVVYQGDGVTTAWPYTFPILNDPANIKVIIVAADGTETTLLDDYYVDYVNSTVHYPGYPPGSESAFPPPILQTGERIVIYRDIPVTQEKDLGEKWPFNVIELGLDKLTMILQGLAGRIGSCLKVSRGSGDFNVEVDAKPGEAIVFNDAGTGLTTSPITGSIEAGNRAYKNKTIPINFIYPDNFTQTINGITWTVGNGMVSASGTASTDSNFFCTALTLDPGEYIVSGCPANGSSGTYDVYVDKGNGKGTGLIVTPVARDYGTPSIVNHFTFTEKNNVFYCCRVFAGQTVNNLVFKPMIRPATVETAEFAEYIPTNKELATLLFNGGEHIAPYNDAVMSQLANVAASYYKFYNFDGTSSKFTYGGTLKRIWDFFPQKDNNNKYQISCSVFAGILLYGITYENSAYNVPGENYLSPTAYQSKELYYDMCYEYTEDGLSYYASQHLAQYCMEHGYTFVPFADMSNVQPGDLLFYNMSNENRPFYRHVNHCEMVAYRINDYVFAVWDAGSSRGPGVWTRLVTDLQDYLVFAARVPIPCTRSINYENLVLGTEQEEVTTNNNVILKEFHVTETLKAWRQYTLIAHITINGSIGTSYPGVYDTGGGLLSKSYQNATHKPANNIYVIPFIPRSDITILQLRINSPSGNNTVDYLCVVDGLVPACPDLDWIKRVSS